MGDEGGQGSGKEGAGGTLTLTNLYIYYWTGEEEGGGGGGRVEGRKGGFILH